MKQLFFAIVCLVSTSAYASSFLGQTAPFGYGENETLFAKLTCKNNGFRYYEFWAGRGGKYSIPRHSVDTVEIHYGENKIITIDSSKEWVNARGMNFDLGEVSCIKEILFTGRSEGIESLGKYPIEVWGK